MAVDGLLFALTLIAALACGVSAGALFAFSSFVMRALAEMKPAEGMRAMQSINVQAVTPAFMVALLGTGVLAAVLAVWGALSLENDYGTFLLVGGVLYLAGPVATTIAFNVPRNNALADADPDDPAGVDLWRRYLVEWTRWNHVRVLFGVAAAAMFTVALTVG